ncbi:hypothetical protein ES703_102792 [subsurface metagenome]
MFSCQLLYQHILDKVGVLELINQYVQIARLISVKDFGMIIEQLCCLHQQIIEIHPLTLSEQLLIAFIDSLNYLFKIAMDLLIMVFGSKKTAFCTTDC